MLFTPRKGSKPARSAYSSGNKTLVRSLFFWTATGFYFYPSPENDMISPYCLRYPVNYPVWADENPWQQRCRVVKMPTPSNNVRQRHRQRRCAQPHSSHYSLSSCGRFKGHTNWLFGRIGTKGKVVDMGGSKAEAISAIFSYIKRNRTLWRPVSLRQRNALLFRSLYDLGKESSISGRQTLPMCRLLYILNDHRTNVW